MNRSGGLHGSVDGKIQDIKEDYRGYGIENSNDSKEFRLPG